MARNLMALMSGLALAACTVVGIRSGTEEPAHDVVDHVGPVEIRAYAATIAAETIVADDEEDARTVGFRRLAGYIFGGNTAGAAIAMTAPVAQQPGQTIAMTAPVAQDRVAGGWSIRFTMPRDWTLERLPRPNDPLVHLVTVPARTMAVLGFTGDRGPEAVHARQQDLARRLDGSAWAVAGAPVAWFYDPPWTLPWLRRNEVAVPVTRR
jgi:hypothetical protein